MKLVAYDPFVSEDRRPSAERRAPVARRPHRPLRLRHAAPGQDARDGRADRRGAAGARRSPRCASSTSPAAASSTSRRSPTRSPRGTSPAPASTSSPRSRATDSPLFELDSVVVTPAPRCVHRRGAGQGGRHDRRHGRAGTRRRLRALRRERLRRRGVRDGASVPRPGRAARSHLRRAQLVGTRAARDRVPGPDRGVRHADPHAVAAQGVLRGHLQRPGVVRERPADRRGARRRGASRPRPRRLATTSTWSPSAAATTASPAPSWGSRRRRAW